MLNLLTQIPLHKLNYDYMLYTNHMHIFAGISLVAIVIAGLSVILAVCIVDNKNTKIKRISSYTEIMGMIFTFLFIITGMGEFMDYTTPLNTSTYDSNTLRKANVISNIRNNEYSDIPYYKHDIRHYQRENSHMKTPYQHTFDNDIKDDKGIIKNMRKYNQKHVKDIQHPLINHKF